MKFAVKLVTALVAVAFAGGCGGTVPLLHPARTLAEGELDVGAGVTAQIAPDGIPSEEKNPAIAELADTAVAPGLAPWVGGRLGLFDNFEAGLIYTGRNIRLDGRRAFEIGALDLSLGVAAHAALPKQAGNIRAGGGGAELPIVIGYTSDADIYSIWLGARGGFELLRGKVEREPSSPGDVLVVDALDAVRIYGGGLLGFRVGFRYVYAAIELDANVHWFDGTVGSATGDGVVVTVSPAGAVVGHF